MTNKILVTVCVPMLEKSYDIYIPVFKYVGVTIELLIKAVNELTEEHFPKEDCNLLSEFGVPFDKSKTIKECGIKNGDKVVLI